MRKAVIARIVEEFRAEVADCQPSLMATADAAEFFDLFTSLEKSVGSVRTLIAGRAADARVWEKEGFRSAADWMAQKTGSGIGETLGTIENSERLLSLPETTEALKRGELSGPQIRELVPALAETPSAEKELLQAAQAKSLKGLKEQCRRTKARAMSEANARARYENIRRTRFLRTWTETDGAGRIEARLTPDDYARFLGAIGQETTAIFHEARKSGRREPSMAYGADALVALVTGTSGTGTGGTNDSTSPGPDRAPRRSSTSPPTTMMHLRVELAALRRGYLENDECCEIPGVGPVPLATAVNVFGHAILKVIITDGVDVRTVCHVGRAIPAHIRSALDDRDEKCVVPGCEVEKGLEIDHYQIDFAQDGPTELWNLCRLCRWHHHLKTHCGYRLSGQPGSWEWKAPESENNPILSD
jgi:uncharacterized protein DUF222